MALRHDPEALERMVLHVRYEFDRMLLWFSTVVTDAEARPEHPDLITLLNQATFESSLLHLRNVIDCVARPRDPRLPSNLVADDYFDDKWADRPAALLSPVGDQEEHQRELNQLHRRVAHLSVQRLEGEPPTAAERFEWGDYLGRAVPSAVAGYESFLGDLGREHPERRQWFSRLKEILPSPSPNRLSGARR
jgi:hypothetical protein